MPVIGTQVWESVTRYATKTPSSRTSSGAPILIVLPVLSATRRLIPSFHLNFFKALSLSVFIFWSCIIAFLLLVWQECFRACVAGCSYKVSSLWKLSGQDSIYWMVHILIYMLEILHHSLSLQFDIPEEKLKQVHARPPKPPPEEKPRPPAAESTPPSVSIPSGDEVLSTSA